jgi:thioredoxin reductase
MAKHLVIVGAGPVGLEMAVAALKEDGDAWRVTVIERGEKVAQNMRNWGHVSLFSAWALNTSEHGRSILSELSQPLPDSTQFPTGNELVAGYLDFLSEWISKHERGQVRTATSVAQIGRSGGCLKGVMGAATRRANQFNILVTTGEDDEEYILADAVVDASGTYGNGNFSGNGGIPALGERKAAKGGRIIRDVPDPLGADKERFAGAKDIAVLGSGYSAITTLNALAKLSETLVAEGKEAPSITWLTRRTGQPYELIDNDPLPQRVVLAEQGNAWAAASDAGDDGAKPVVRRVGGVALQSFGAAAENKLNLVMQVEGKEQREMEVDYLVSNCGFRPDTSFSQELQIHQCYASEGPMKLAAAMMAASGTASADCLQQVAPGADTLRNPEPGFFILGMKSYGRGSKFIMKIGHEQVGHALTLLKEHAASL